MVVSTINPAQETVTYVSDSGAELTKFTRTMDGGGTQFVSSENTVANIEKFVGP